MLPRDISLIETSRNYEHTSSFSLPIKMFAFEQRHGIRSAVRRWLYVKQNLARRVGCLRNISRDGTDPLKYLDDRLDTHIVVAMRKQGDTTVARATWQRNGATLPHGDTDLFRCISLISNMKSKVFPPSRPRAAPDNARDKTYLARINTLMDEPVF